MRILAIGVTARALAHSIAAAGHTPCAVDWFGDRDLVETCTALGIARLGLPFSAEALLEAARGLAPFDGLIPAGGLENAPDVVAALSKLGQLFGNSPACLAAVRNWDRVRRTLRGHGFQTPDSLPLDASVPLEGSWLWKPLRGGGGIGIEPAEPGSPPRPGCRLEARVQGQPGSALFLADGKRARLLGITDQIDELEGLSAPGFAYRGNILRNDVLPSGTERVTELCDLLVRSYGLLGLNGIDFIWSGAEPVALEINPRWTASAELWEQATGQSLVPFHLEAVVHRQLPESLPTFTGVFGKAILYGVRPGVWRFASGWRASGLRDVPHEGDPVIPGRPVCTVLAAGADAAEVHQQLSTRAQEVRRMWIV